MIKIFILGLDGLEYNFVEKWNLIHLKQKEYGKVTVPIDKITQIPKSPEVWASFLTGKYIHLGFQRPNAPLDIVFKLLKFARKHINLSLNLGRKIKHTVPTHVHGQYAIGFPDLKEKTFLDLTNSKGINVPFYNYDNKLFTIIAEFNSGNLSLGETVNLVNREYEKNKKQILSEIKKIQKTDIVFAYIHFPDMIQHLLFVKPSRIKKHYFDLDKYVSHLESEVKNSTFIIISDHGFDFKINNHSQYGFYSSNSPLKPKPRTITDFFPYFCALSRRKSVAK